MSKLESKEARRIRYLAPCGICWDGSDVFYPADAHAGTGECPECTLCSRTGCFGACATGRTQFDVQSGDTDLTATRRDVLGGQHRCIWR